MDSLSNNYCCVRGVRLKCYFSSNFMKPTTNRAYHGQNKVIILQHCCTLCYTLCYTLLYTLAYATPCAIPCATPYVTPCVTTFATPFATPWHVLHSVLYPVLHPTPCATPCVTPQCWKRHRRPSQRVTSLKNTPLPIFIQVKLLYTKV